MRLAAAPDASRRSAARSTSPTPAPRPRGGDQARAQGPAGRRRSSSVHRRLPRAHLRRRCRPRRRRPSRRRSRRSCPGFGAVAPTAEAITAAVDERTAAVLLEPVQGESGVHVLGDDAAGRGARGLRRARRGADLRRGPVRPGAHRDAVGLPGLRRRARRADDAPRRSAAACRSARWSRGAAPGRRVRARRPRLDVRRRPGAVRRAGARRDGRRRRRRRCWRRVRDVGARLRRG